MSNTWIQTYSGRRFDPFAPDPWSIDPVDIAWHLSMKVRYNGACLVYYSVAEHSVILSQWFETQPADFSPANLSLARAALFHDANEAYLPDVPRPIKREPSFFATWKPLEDRVDKAIFERFGLGWPIPEAVAEADGRIILDERAQVMRRDEAEWRGQWGVGQEPLGVRIEGWGQKTAVWRFLERFHELF